MRLVPVTELRPDSEVAIDILDEHSKIVIKKGCTITKRNIERLKYTNISSIYIKDKYCFANTATYTAQSKNVLHKVIFLKQFAQLSLLGVTPKEVMIEAINTVNDIINVLHDYKHIYKIRYEPKKINGNDFEEKTVYIAIMSSLLALKVGFSKHDAAALCLAALLRDISLVQPSVKWEKVDPPKHHPIQSSKYLAENYNLPKPVLEIVEQHHELYDGKGYPYNLKGENICKGARILAIIDIYYRIKTVSLDENNIIGIELEFNKLISHFDPYYVDRFLRNVVIYDADILIKLTTGDIGVVTDIQPKNPFKPQIKIVKSCNYTIGDILNLYKMNDVKINKIVYYVD
ncbi:MAG: hypothetical protein ATN35_10860 [Epulopiscium sp. Nele67-Bin004]|nr:MAG: hypothetical protein ATN35_10860 [Epulopiscium sp. Nele67-Bin004]